ncbi:MAG: AraC family transcriptional regulator [Anaerolineales bacterium]|jgi:AraC-like DNA-binding protein
MEKLQSPSGIQVTVAILKQMFLYLDSIDFGTDALLISLGVDPDLAKSPDGYIPIETYLRIEEAAAEATNDPSFGFHMGQYAEPGSWSILGYLMMNCRTLGEAFEKSGRYSRVIGNLIEGEPHFGINKITMISTTPAHAPNMPRYCFESAFTSGVRMMRSLTGLELSPLEVTFIYPQPALYEEYERFFRCPVIFDHKVNSMSIHPKLLHTPILLPNPGLLEYFENYAQQFIAEMDRQDAYTQAVTRILLENLDNENLSIKQVAKEMSVSVRTLQNRLKDEGVVFSDLLSEVRQQLAQKYLKENYSVEEITYLLGFSEPSVFRKAFKRWSGITPRQYRERPVPTANLSFQS